MMQKLFRTKHEGVSLSRRADEISTNFLADLNRHENEKFSHLLKKSKISLEDILKKDAFLENQHYNTWACYFGAIDRPSSEELLHRNGDGEGLYLVRNGSKVGDFTLSFVHGDKPIHFHIDQHGLGAQYSIEGGDLFSGLDKLLEHFSQQADGLPTRLAAFCRNGMPLPFSATMFGRTNVLHRVVRENNARLARMVLDSGRYAEHVNARGADGDAALHTAAHAGADDLVGMLVDAGADVDAKDAQGQAPLHRACAGDRASTVSLLVSRYDCDAQEPCYRTGWVALHVAASWGHADCAKVLLALNAPARPRTNKGEIPADLAREAGNEECARMLDDYQAPPARADASRWLHAAANRTTARRRLERAGLANGQFLVRASGRHAGMHILTMACDRQVYNYEVERRRDDGGRLCIGNGPLLDSLEHLVDHYSRFKDGLPTRLSEPVADPDWTPELRTRHDVDPAGEAAAAAATTEEVPVPAGLRLIYKADLQLGDKIGDGEYGSVLKGMWTDPTTGIKYQVAVKTTHEDHSQNKEFLREAEVMMKLKHDCVVQLIGVSCEPPLMIVQELLPVGSLLDFLLDHPSEVDPDTDLRLWAAQVASGMRYLEAQKVVHRDLAARNILLANHQHAKISDFGLSRVTRAEKDYYRATEGGKWPVKWYAPECIYYGQFSHASDVWSYGVTLWEMWTFGEQPYGERGGQAVLKMIDSGERLTAPPGCPRKIYKVMQRCWQYDPAARPTFADLQQLFESDADYQQIVAMVTKSRIA
ncbi:PREDICTED: tyrosine-protein kinase HTK16-like [Priapulus caudatus]|uniref:Tyrosine-protein kinase n=1 Tax=Priapulus caudatus TaxID=37621 RepID=A0ABM1EF69_PRICU|nr:PREDICTED: tyrosine-protein kinase HTK16-like [Priapulus caudatus]